VVIGVDVGGTKIAAAAVARDCSLSDGVSLPTPKDGQQLLDAVADAVRQVVTATGAAEIVGVGLPSLIEQPAGIVRATANADLANVDALGELTRRIQLPVVLDNDGNVAAIAEHAAGAGVGHANVVMLTLGTGVGGGVIVDGKPMRGGHGRGAELGHMVVQADGPRCQRNCPNRGCLETMVSGTAVARDSGMDAPTLVKLARQGDAEALQVLRRAGRYLGVGLSSLANIFSPDVFVIGGGFGSAARELVLDAALAEYHARALGPNATAAVVPARLGASAGVVGAGLLAWQAVDARG
jgi:glucokinase